MRNLCIAILMLCSIIGRAEENIKVNFYQGNITRIRQNAMASGKLYVLDFVANWCTPCKLMEETTFTDAALADYVAANYIFAKVNIDDFDGLALKQKYDVRYLPTILVFNQNGEIVARHEQSITASNLLDLLQIHNIPENGAGKVTKINVSEQKRLVSFSKTTPVSKNEAIKTEKVLENKIQKKAIRVEEKAVSVKSNSPKAKNLATYNIGTGLYRLDISRVVNKGYSIQAAALSQYENVIKFYEEAKQQHANQPIFLLVEYIDNKIVYKILVGEFKNKEAAEMYRKEKVNNGYIKKL